MFSDFETSYRMACVVVGIFGMFHAVAMCMGPDGFDIKTSQDLYYAVKLATFFFVLNLRYCCLTYSGYAKYEQSSETLLICYIPLVTAFELTSMLVHWAMKKAHVI